MMIIIFIFLAYDEVNLANILMWAKFSIMSQTKQMPSDCAFSQRCRISLWQSKYTATLLLHFRIRGVPLRKTCTSILAC